MPLWPRSMAQMLTAALVPYPWVCLCPWLILGCDAPPHHLVGLGWGMAPGGMPPAAARDQVYMAALAAIGLGPRRGAPVCPSPPLAMDTNCSDMDMDNMDTEHFLSNNFP